jgi:hypothetical protein
VDRLAGSRDRRGRTAHARRPVRALCLFFSLAEPDRNRDLLDAAGFSDVRVEEIAEARRYDGFDDYWDHHSHATSPVAALVSSLSAEDIESIRAALWPKLEQFLTGTGYEIPSLVVAVSAAGPGG